MNTVTPGPEDIECCETLIINGVLTHTPECEEEKCYNKALTQTFTEIL